MTQTANRSVQLFSHRSWQSVGGMPGHVLNPNNCPIIRGIWNSGPHLIHASLGPPESITQTASQSLQPFLHSSWQKVPILYNERPSPKLPLSMEGSGPPSKCIITWTHPRPQPKRHLDRFSRFCTDDRRVSLYFTVGCPSPSKLSLPMGDVDPI